jgi:hypothetical protein
MKYYAIMIGLGLGTVLAACGTFEVDIERFPTQTAVPVQFETSTASPSLAAASATASPSLPPASSSTPAPVPTPLAARIQFAEGATRSITRGTLYAGQPAILVLRAMKDQVLVASADTTSHNVALSVTGADGNIVPRINPGTAPAFMAVLPETQDYFFRLTDGDATQDFELDVTVAARIQFAAGENQATLSGRTVGGLPITYSAHAQKGQTMHVLLDAPQDSAALSIWGLSDGTPYLRTASGSTESRLVLPSEQEYVIEVVPRVGQQIDYIITVQID